MAAPSRNTSLMCTEIKLGRVDVHGDDTRGAARLGPHDARKAHGAQPEHRHRRALAPSQTTLKIFIISSCIWILQRSHRLDVGRVEDGSVASGDAASEQAHAVKRRLLRDLTT